MDELRTVQFWVLVSLSGGRRHGYAIMREAEELSSGQVRLKVPTLYGALERLSRDRLVAPDGDEAVDGRLRRYFCITQEGTVALRAEVERMELSSRVARLQLGSVRASFA